MLEEEDVGVLIFTTEDAIVVAESSSSVEASSSSSSVSGLLLFTGLGVVVFRVRLVRGGEINEGLLLRVLRVRGGEIDDVDLVELRVGDREGCLRFDFGEGCFNLLLLRVAGLRSPEGFFADDVAEVPKIRRT